MKYVVVLCDGMADYPVPALGGKTPMMVAKKPHIDALAAKAEVGLVRTVAPGLKPGSDVANMSVLGFDPHRFYTGRSPLEAASIGIDMKDIRIYEDSNSGIRNAYDAGCEQILSLIHISEPTRH